MSCHRDRGRIARKLVRARNAYLNAPTLGVPSRRLRPIPPRPDACLGSAAHPGHRPRRSAGYHVWRGQRWQQRRTDRRATRTSPSADAAGGRRGHQRTGFCRDADRRRGRAGGHQLAPLVIYYFGTKDRLLLDALRFSEQSLFEQIELMLADVHVRTRAALPPDPLDVPSPHESGPRAGDLGALAGPVGPGHPSRREVARGRAELDARWRSVIVDIVRGPDRRDGDIGDVDVDVRRFADYFRRPARRPVDPGRTRSTPRSSGEAAYEIAMRFRRTRTRHLACPPLRKVGSPTGRQSSGS